MGCSLRRLAISAVSGLVIASAAPIARATPEDAAEVERTDAAIQAAVNAGDAAVLEQIVAPDFVMFHGGGDWEDRTGWLNKVRQRRLSRLRSEATEYDARVRVLGDAAIRSWIVRFRDAGRGEDVWIRGARTFVRMNGAWRLAAQQASLLQEGPLAPPQDLAPFAGRYRITSRRGGEVRFEDRRDYLLATYDTGEHVAVTPRGGSMFGMGVGSTLQFDRTGDGRITAVRRAGERELWRAERVSD